MSTYHCDHIYVLHSNINYSVPYILLFMYWLAVVHNTNVTVLCSSILFVFIVIAFRCIVVGCALHIMVFSVPPSECVGWYGHLLPLQYTTYLMHGV